MPKINKNNRITSGYNSYGRLEQHDAWLNQGVLNSSDPTFNNLRLTGDGYIEGSLTVDGAFTVLSTEILELADNIILINREETGSGVTLNLGGIEVERGSGSNYQFVFQESDDTFRSGFVGNLQAISHREDMPLNNGVGVWNNTQKRFDSKTEINLDIFFNSLTNSINSATGNIITSGGVGIAKDVHIDGRIYLTGTLPNKSVVYTDVSTNDLQVESPGNIDLVPTTNITIPANKSLIFHNTSQSISSTTAGRLMITSSSDLHITPATNKSIIIPNQIPIQFSTATERIYTDSSNHMNIESGQDINLTPGSNKRILVPVDVGIVLSNNNQFIKANTSNDVTIQAGNNINLTPGSLLNVKIPTDNGILFGSVGTQRIYSNSLSELIIQSTSDIYLTPNVGGDINIPSTIGVTFGSDLQKIEGDTAGNLAITANTSTQREIQLLSDVYILTTRESTGGSVGSLHTNGGIGAVKTILSKESFIVDSDSSVAIKAIKSGGRETFKVSNASTGNISVNTGDGTITNSGMTITNESGINAKSHIMMYGGTFDTRNGYSIGHGTNAINIGRAMTFNIPEASEYGDTTEPKYIWYSNDLTTELFTIEARTGDITVLGGLGLTGTENATNATTGSMVIQGGLGVVKDIYLDGKMTIDETNANAFLVRKEDDTGNVFNVDTSSLVVRMDSELILDHTSVDALKIQKTGGGRVVLKVDTFNETITNDAPTYITDTTESANVSGGALVVSGGMSVIKKFFVGGESKMLSALDMSSQYIKNVANPINNKDAANKEYVDLIKQGLYVKDSVKVATTTTGTLSTSYTVGQTIDSYVLILNDRILIKDQIDAVENGIYIVQTVGVPTRPSDFDPGDDASGTFTFVQEGIINKNIGWICNNPTTADTIGTDPLNFTQFTGLGLVVAGSGLSKTFNTMDINVDNMSLEISTDALRISNSTIGTGLTGGSGIIITTTTDQSHVTKLGTINTGVWEGMPVSVLYGGTGQTQFTNGNILIGSSTTQLTSSTDLYFNNTSKFFGVGTNNNPSFKLHIQDTSNAIVRIDADKLGSQPLAYPELSLTFNNSATKGLVGMSRTDNQYANGTLPGALVISQNNTDTSSRIQLATNQETRMTIEQMGNIGINNTDPGYLLDINGTLNVEGLVTMRETTNATNLTSGSVVMYGGLSVTKDQYIGGDAYIKGVSIELGKKLTAQTLTLEFNTSGNNLDYDTRISSSGGTGNVGEGSLFIDADIVSLRAKNKVLFTSTKETTSTTEGSIVISGGVGIVKDVNIGESINVEGIINNKIGAIELVTSGVENYINSGNTTRTNASFVPLNIGEYNSTGGGVSWTFHSGGAVLLNQGTLQIGGSLSSIDGYKLSFDGVNELNIIPVVNGDMINIGSVGSNLLSDVRINGTNGSSILWQSGSKTLRVEDTTTIYRKNGNTKNIQFSTPDSSDTSRFNAQIAPMTINFGESGTHELTVELSNINNTSSIVYTPNTTHSNLVLTNNVYSTFNGPTTFNDTITLVGNSQLISIENTDTGNAKWYYLGRINTTSGSALSTEKGYIDMTVYNGVDYDSVLENGPNGIKFIGTTYNTNFKSQHSHFGTGVNTSTILKSIIYVYNDTLDNYHLFIRASAESKQTIRVNIQNHTALSVSVEGTGSVPDGTVSGYTGWVQEFNSDMISTMREYIGDMTIERELYVSDNLPIIGYNNTNTTSSRDVGLLLSRYQVANDSGLGDIVNDTATETNSIPSQVSASSTQLILSGLANGANDYYNGWWVKVVSGASNNQTRRIIGYNGSLKVATLETAWTTQNPSVSDNVFLYDTNYSTLYYNESLDKFIFGYTTSDPGYNSNIVLSRTASIEANRITVTDTTASTSSVMGGIISSGGLSISQTNNATSGTNGGTITTAGGIGVGKDIRVNSGIYIGSNGDTLERDLKIRKTNVSISLHNDSISSNSFIDFEAEGSSNRGGILLFNNQLLLTSNTSSTTPNVSIPSMVLDIPTSYISIGTTSNISSQLTMKGDTFIGVNTIDTLDDKYLGLVGGGGNTSTSTRGARIELSGNERITKEGLLLLSAGNAVGSTSGSIQMETLDICRLEIDYPGNVTIKNTTISTSSTQGALIVNGGLSIRSSQNSTSYTSGGALTVGGGGSINGNLYVDGNIIASGALSGGGSVVIPTLTFMNTTNCVVNTYDNQRIILTGTEALFSAFVESTPILGSLDTSFEFNVPNRTVNWTNISEFVGHIQGFKDNSTPVQLMNAIVYAIVGTTRARVKYQSIDTTSHYITVICRYVAA